MVIVNDVVFDMRSFEMMLMVSLSVRVEKRAVNHDITSLDAVLATLPIGSPEEMRGLEGKVPGTGQEIRDLGGE